MNFRKSDGRQLPGLLEQAQRVNTKGEVVFPDKEMSHSQLQKCVQGRDRSDLEGESVLKQVMKAELELQDTAKLPCSSVVRDTLSSLHRVLGFVHASNKSNSLVRMEKSK